MGFSSELWARNRDVWTLSMHNKICHSTDATKPPGLNPTPALRVKTLINTPSQYSSAGFISQGPVHSPSENVSMLEN